jgi:hypothetical protein
MPNGVAAMPDKRILVGAALIALGAVTFADGAASLATAEPAGAPGAARIAPIPPGFARVWFLRQFQPSESLRMPMIFIDGAPLASSQPGTVFYRDVAPGTYNFSVETCTTDTNQAATLTLEPGSQTNLEVQSLSSFRSWGCLSQDTFYVRVIPPAWAERYLPQLGYLGPR